ncbi:hypothetical protein COBT_004251, partial [Conglomerata obtusa]
EIKKKDQIELGDVVLYRNLNKKDKLDTKWTGPFVVQHKNECGSFIIADPTKEKNIVTHQNNIKRILSDENYKKTICNNDQSLVNENFKEGRIVDAEASLNDNSSS